MITKGRKYSFIDIRDAAVAGITPDQHLEAVTLRVVEEGEKIFVNSDTSSIFGSGVLDYFCCYYGKEPIEVSEADLGDNGFVKWTTYYLTLPRGCSVYSYEYADPPGRFSREIFLRKEDVSEADPSRFIEALADKKSKAEAEEQKRRKDFATEQHRKLLEMKLSPQQASQIIKNVGPGLAVKAAAWGTQLPKTDNVKTILIGVLHANFGRKRKISILKKHDIFPFDNNEWPVSSAWRLSAMLRGALIALGVPNPSKAALSSPAAESEWEIYVSTSKNFTIGDAVGEIRL